MLRRERCFLFLELVSASQFAQVSAINLNFLLSLFCFIASVHLVLCCTAIHTYRSQKLPHFAFLPKSTSVHWLFYRSLNYWHIAVWNWQEGETLAMDNLLHQSTSYLTTSSLSAYLLRFICTVLASLLSS